MKTILKLTAVLFFTVSSVFAQEAVTDTELENFAKAIVDLQSINLQAQTEMINVVQSAGLDLDDFEPLYEAKMTNDTEALAKLTEAETRNLDNILARFDALGAYYDRMAEDMIAKSFTLERFDEISVQLDNDPALVAKLQSLLEEE